MRLSSHMRIADITAEIIEELTDIEINKKYMRIGSIMPDILPHRRRQLHSPNKVAQHYEKEFARIVLKNPKIKRISFILGLLTHYITDAFCLSHNEYVVNLKKHIEYEYFLDDFKDQYHIPEDIMDKIKNCSNRLEEMDSDTKRYVDEMNRKYLEVVEKDDWMKHVEHDFDQAIIHVSTLMSEFVLKLIEADVVFA